MDERRQLRKEFCLKYLGECCVVCGSVEDLQFDHIDPLTKSKDISKMYTHSLENLRTELDKCQLLCLVHHQEKSFNERQRRAIHGRSQMYKDGCRCKQCCESKSQANFRHRVSLKTRKRTV